MNNHNRSEQFGIVWSVLEWFVEYRRPYVTRHRVQAPPIDNVCPVFVEKFGNLYRMSRIGVWSYQCGWVSRSANMSAIGFKATNERTLELRNNSRVDKHSVWRGAILSLVI